MQSAHEIRTRKSLMSTEIVQELVDECLGVVPVLCIVGRCRTGKSWATKEWADEHNNRLNNVAYVDCKNVGFFPNNGSADIAFDGVHLDARAGHYPALALDGVDIVIVDEPHVNEQFVIKLLRRTSIDPIGSAHRLIILLVQHNWLRVLEEIDGAC